MAGPSIRALFLYLWVLSAFCPCGCPALRTGTTHHRRQPMRSGDVEFEAMRRLVWPPRVVANQNAPDNINDASPSGGRDPMGETRRLHQVGPSSFRSRLSTALLFRTLRATDVLAVEKECFLAQDDVERYLDRETRTWRIDDALLSAVGNDLQRIVDCSSGGDTMLLNSTTRIRPARRIHIRWKLTWSAHVDSSASADGVFPAAAKRQRITCPEDDPGIFVVKAAGVLFANFIFRGCNLTSSAVVEVNNCAGTYANDPVKLHHVRFEHNALMGASALKTDDCLGAELTDVDFVSNRCTGRGCGAHLGAENTLRNIALHDNVGRGQPATATSFLFFAPESDSVIEDLSASGNRLVMVESDTAALKIRKSRFLNTSASADRQTSGVDGRDDEEDLYGACLFVFNSTVDIRESRFEGNSATVGSAVAAVQSKLVANDTQFAKNAAAKGGALYLARRTSASLMHCRFFNNNASMQGGAAYIEASNLTLEDLSSLNNSAFEAGGAFFGERSHISVLRSHFETGDAASGGFFHLDGTSLDSAETSFEDGSAEYGGAVRMDNRCSADLQDCNFSRNNASKYGGAFLVEAESVLKLRHCNFSQGYPAKIGSFVALRNSFINGRDSHFDSGYATLGGALSVEAYSAGYLKNCSLSNNVAERGGAVYLEDEARLRVNGCNFTQGSAEYGGFFFAFHSILNVSGSRFSKGQAVHGGVIYVDDKSMGRMKHCAFSQNTANTSGGTIHLEDKVTFVLSDSVFEGGRAPSGGFVYATQAAFEVTRSVFKKGTAGSGGAVDLESGSQLNIKDSRFEECNATSGGAIAVKSSALEGEGLMVVRNMVTERGAGVYVMAESNVSFRKSDFEQNAVLYGGGGGCFVEQSTARFSESSFARNEAENGGAIVLSRSNATVVDSTFRNCSARRLGGAIQVDESSRLTIADTSIAGAEAEQGGGLDVQDSVFNARHLRVYDCRAKSLGGAFSAAGDSLVACSNCKFRSNLGAKGGAVALSGLYAARPFSSAQFFRTEFLYNSADYGGGLFVDEGSVDCAAESVHCSRAELSSSVFSDNNATVAGGAVFSNNLSAVAVTCPPDPRHSHPTCPTDKGKALDQLVRDNSSCVAWPGNSAGYGPVAASYATDVRVTVNGGTLNENNFTVAEHRSGDDLPSLSFRLIDDLQQSPAAPNASRVEMELHCPENTQFTKFEQSMDDGYGEMKGIKVVARAGTYRCGVHFGGAALRPVHITVDIKECQINEVKGKDGLTCERCSGQSYNFDPEQTECQRCPDNADCSSSFISSTADYWHRTPCSRHIERCLTRRACDAEGREDKLKALIDKTTSCNFSDAAILAEYGDAQCAEGHTGPVCGSCEPAYGRSRDHVCNPCYSKGGSVLLILASGLMVFILSAITIHSSRKSAANLARKKRLTRRMLSTASSSAPVDEPDTQTEVELQSLTARERNSSDGRKGLDDASVHQTELQTVGQIDETEMESARAIEMFKIIVNYTQVLSIAVAINVEWSEVLLKVFEAAQFAGGVASGAVSQSIDCILSDDAALERSIAASLVGASLPFAVLTVFVILWIARGMKQPLHLGKCIGLSTVVVFYICYASLTRTSLAVLSCVEIHDAIDHRSADTAKYWAPDTRVRCHEGSHVLLEATVGWPLLCLFSFGFPAVLTCITAVFVKVDEKEGWIYEIAGFTYRTYRQDYVYWESVIMFRKALLAAVVVFAYPLGPNLQAVLAVLVLVAALYLQQRCRPFGDSFEELNQMESLSILISLITFQSSIFFHDDRVSKRIELLITVCITACNVGLVLLFVRFFFCFAPRFVEVFLDAKNIPSNAALGIFHQFKVFFVDYAYEKIKDRASNLRIGRYAKQKGDKASDSRMSGP